VIRDAVRRAGGRRGEEAMAWCSHTRLSKGDEFEPYSQNTKSFIHLVPRHFPRESISLFIRHAVRLILRALLARGSMPLPWGRAQPCKGEDN